MGCIWSSKPSSRCGVCNGKQSRDAGVINNTCRLLAVQSRPSSTKQYHESISRLGNTSVTNEKRSYVRGVLPQQRPNASIKPQFGEFYCKSCGRSWESLRSWSTKYQMCKRCRTPVYPHKLRILLSSDYTNTIEDSKEHERELCQMCRHLGYACKYYGKNDNRRQLC